MVYFYEPVKADMDKTWKRDDAVLVYKGSSK